MAFFINAEPPTKAEWGDIWIQGVGGDWFMWVNEWRAVDEIDDQTLNDWSNEAVRRELDGG